MSRFSSWLSDAEDDIAPLIRDQVKNYETIVKRPFDPRTYLDNAYRNTIGMFERTKVGNLGNFSPKQNDIKLAKTYLSTASQNARALQLSQARRRSGRSSTILTGNLGLNDSLNMAKKTLLGD